MNEKLVSLMADMQEEKTLALVRGGVSKGADPVSQIKEFKPQVVGLSGFLTIAFDSTKKNIKAIEAAGLGDSIMIMIGGGQIDKEVRKYTGADAYGKDAVAAVQFSKQWIGV